MNTIKGRRYVIIPKEKHTEKNHEGNNTYSYLLLQDDWKNFKLRIIERDKNKCINCQETKNLHVHHRHYIFNTKKNKFVLPWEYPLSSLITLCERCHNLGHTKYKIPTIYI